ncbi:MAG: hypothetical protein Q8P33_00720 [bacterium]|nr:hypothetical protein [bacterium]
MQYLPRNGFVVENRRKEIVTVKQHLEKGMKVKILENGEVIDEAIVRRVGTGGHPRTQEIEIESLNLYPGKTTEFAWIRHSDPSREGWRMLFEDPMTGGRCFSQLAPICVFEPA